MGLTAAVILAQTSSFLVFALMAWWHAAPRLRAMSRVATLTPLIWVHGFRQIALVLFSVNELQNGVIPPAARDQIAYGDYIGFLLAILSLILLRYRPAWAVPVVWLLVIATVVDLGNAIIVGVQEELLGAAFGVAWSILGLYVPLLWLSVVLIAWQLLSRPGEPLEARVTRARGRSRPAAARG